MRDETIYQMKAIEARRAAMMYQQLEFLSTRQEAFEKVLSNRWNILTAFFNPAKFKTMVDRLNISLYNEKQVEHEEAAKKVKEEARKPKLSIVGAVNGLNGSHK